MELREFFEQIKESDDPEAIKDIADTGIDFMQTNQLTDVFNMAFSNNLKTIIHFSGVSGDVKHLHGLADIALNLLDENKGRFEP